MRFFQNLVAADVSRRKYLKLPRTNVRGYEVLKELHYTGSPDPSCAVLTVEIEPESFPPDKTIIVPQGTPGANIVMEASGDLVHWTNAPPSLYTNTEPSHLFFRLRAERL